MRAPTLSGASTYYFVKISQKLHEIEIIWHTGVRPSRLSLDLPLINVYIHFRSDTKRSEIGYLILNKYHEQGRDVKKGGIPIEGQCNGIFNVGDR